MTLQESIANLRKERGLYRTGKTKSFANLNAAIEEVVQAYRAERGQAAEDVAK